MKKIYKKIVNVTLIFCMIISFINTGFASEFNSIENKDDNFNLALLRETLNIISEEELLKRANQDLSRSTNDTYIYVTGYNNFVPYSQTEFWQTNGCGPTAVANILSYFQMARSVRLFDGDYITQNIYNQICSDVSWTTSGTSMADTSNGLKIFCNRAGKTCDINTYLLNLWSDVTRDINANKPILCNDVDQRHTMVILGYAVVNNENYLYVCTGTDNPLTGFLKWGTNNLRMRSVNIY